MLKNQNGITLVALVITIIVLLILAGITISLTLGEHGLIQRAQNAGNTYQQSANNEMNWLNYVDDYSNQLVYNATSNQ